jgi:histidyl-tRNA synthetase
MQAQSLPGFRDFFPDETAFRNHMFAAWREVAACYGFEEYDGPPLEPLELYRQKSGDEIVEQLYSFEDKGGREVSLRPEMTPTLARMVAQRARALKKPIRWFSIPQLFRYERQQRGRLREHFQLNMDIIGETGPLADAELIAAAVDAVRAFGLTDSDFRARISDRRVAHALLVGQGFTEEQIPVAYAHVDKLAREPRNELAADLARAAGVSTATADRALGIGELRSPDAVRAQLTQGRTDDDEVLEPLVECLEALQAMGLGKFLELDLSVVRGLAYYTGIVFELFDARRSLRAICGGGRYDGLLEDLGGIDLPAVGFGMGDVVLGELIKARGTVHGGAGLDVFLVAVTSDDVASVLGLAHQLRDRGKCVEYALRQQSVGKQLKLAAARGARQAMLIGPDERAANVVVLRDLGTGEERRVAMKAILEDDSDDSDD